MTRTSGCHVIAAAAGATATYPAAELGFTGHYALSRVDILDTSGAGSTVRLGATSMVQTIAPHERLILNSNIEEVVCVTGAVEVVFYL